MRHRKGLKKIGRTSAHRSAMLLNMAESLLQHERIKTTLVKAKVLRPYIEKIITKSRVSGLATIRYLSSLFSNQDTVRKLTDDIAKRVEKRPGGYTRIYKYGFRRSDDSEMALIELVDKAPDAAKAKQKNKAKQEAQVAEDKVIEHVVEEPKVAKKAPAKTAKAEPKKEAVAKTTKAKAEKK